jgi:hypothetical protein
MITRQVFLGGASATFPRSAMRRFNSLQLGSGAFNLMAMPPALAPGVYLEELSFHSKTLKGVATSR